MAKDSQTAHIVVRSDEEDDDIVIQAGSVPASAPYESNSDSSDEIQDDTEQSMMYGEEAHLEADENGPQPSVRTASDDYRPTTLEDLQEARMSVVQWIILVLAAILVIVVVVWILFFR